MLFTQYTFLDNTDPKMLFGKIYLNDRLVDLNSKEEKLILKGIAKFTITNNLKELDKEHRK